MRLYTYLWQASLRRQLNQQFHGGEADNIARHHSSFRFWRDHLAGGIIVNQSRTLQITQRSM